jgi:hypothetical protein
MLLNEKHAAQYLGCSVGMMRKWRLFGNGPAFSKLGRLVRYQEGDLAAFVAANRVTQHEVGGN